MLPNGIECGFSGHMEAPLDMTEAEARVFRGEMSYWRLPGVKALWLLGFVAPWAIVLTMIAVAVWLAVR